MNDKWKLFDILLGFALGIFIGLGLAISIIDDLDEFKIPMTDKVFVRQVEGEV